MTVLILCNLLIHTPYIFHKAKENQKEKNEEIKEKLLAKKKEEAASKKRRF